MSPGLSRHLLGLLLACVFGAPAPLAQSARPEIYVQQGPESVTSLAVSPDGRLLATGDRTVGLSDVQLYDLLTGREIGHLAHTQVQALAFSRDGRLLATAGREEKQELVKNDAFSFHATVYSVRLWDVAEGRLLRVFLKGSDEVRALAFGPDVKTLVTCDSTATLKLWDTDAAEPTPRAFKLKRALSGLVFSPDGRTLAGVDYDKRLVVWNAQDGRQLFALEPAFQRSVNALLFSPDGRLLVGGSSDKSLRVWDAKTGALLHAIEGLLKGVEAATFSADSTTLAAAVGPRLQRWRVSDWQTLPAPEAKIPDHGVSTFTPDGLKLVSGGYKEIDIADAATGAPLHAITRAASVCHISTDTADGELYLWVELTGTNSKIWDYETGDYLGAFESAPHCPDFSTLGFAAFSPDAATAVVADAAKRGVGVYDRQTGKQKYSLQTGQSYLGAPFVFSSDGKLLAAIGYDGVTKTFDLTNGKQLGSINTNPPAKGSKVTPVSGLTVTDPGTMFPHPLTAAAFSRDGKLLAGSYSDKEGACVVALWGVKGGGEARRVTRQDGDVSALAFSPDGRWLATGDALGRISLWDTRTWQAKCISDDAGRVEALYFLPRGVLASVTAARVKLLDISEGRVLASLVSLPGDDWLVATPDGLFDGTPAAWGQVSWRLTPRLLEAVPVEAFFGDYFYPNLLGEVLAGRRPAASASLQQKDRRQPQVQLTLPEADASKPLTQRVAKVRVTVASAPAGARDVRLFRNEALVKTWPGDVLPAGAASVTLEATIPFVAGENRLTAYAFNRDNVKSPDAPLTVTGDEKALGRRGVLHILSVGVGRYANSSYNLGYTPDDARAFAAEVARRQEDLGQYERVEPVTLVDDAATKAAIIGGLKRIAAAAQPEDGVIIYFSGHGTGQGSQRFYLIPHDLGYAGSRRSLDAAGLEQILAHCISDEELEDAVRAIDAAHLLLVVDACNSGQALNAEERRRGPMNSRGLAQLAYEKGMYVLTASQDVEEAFVSDRLKHSYLTYALIEEGLKTAAADKRPTDGSVWLREWFDYAVRRVPALRGEKLQGKDIKEEAGDAGVGDAARANTRPTRTQTPRAFYRREPFYSRPLVIAHLP